MKKTTELLAPAGSLTSLKAAVEAGADAVYLGTPVFNARINAENFTRDELAEGIKLAHLYGVKVYIAANTLIFERERGDFLRTAEESWLLGADALIVADIGMAKEISKRIPIDLHASTQLSGHNVAAAELLSMHGFSRMVCAREMNEDDLRTFCKSAPIEAEVFVHGALCVSCSGQCLFSSIVGGRSGNRGECAQPCRLPYSSNGKKPFYPLSLRDLSLAAHTKTLIDMGVKSFKIEGRMKSPEYVRDVTSIFRRLIDEHRNATQGEIQQLGEIFSRGGFTDSYFKKSVGHSMLGVRSDSDKAKSRELAPFDKITRKIPIDMSAELKPNAPMRLTLRYEQTEVSVSGDIPQAAINAPLTEETVRRNLSKLGSTPYSLSSLSLSLENGIMLPLSALNSLRRAATDALSSAIERPLPNRANIKKAEFSYPCSSRCSIKTALFYNASDIPKEAFDFFDKIFVPLEQYAALPSDIQKAVGVMLPEVIFDSALCDVEKSLEDAQKQGASCALVCNIGHISLARKYGFKIYGDLRLNVANSSSLEFYESLGLETIILSPELSLSATAALKGNSSAVVYGRLPLMLTEKCIGKELGSCADCSDGKLSLVDRKGVSFPVLRRPPHRSLIVNSVPTYMADRSSLLDSKGISARHFIFTTESAEQVASVISSYISSLPPTSEFRRMG